MFEFFLCKLPSFLLVNRVLSIKKNHTKTYKISDKTFLYSILFKIWKVKFDPLCNDLTIFVVLKLLKVSSGWFAEKHLRQKHGQTHNVDY